MKISKKQLKQIIKETFKEYEEIENYPGDCDDRTSEGIYSEMYAVLPAEMDPDGREWDQFFKQFEDYVRVQRDLRPDPDFSDYESEDLEEIVPPHEEYSPPHKKYNA